MQHQDSTDDGSPFKAYVEVGRLANVVRVIASRRGIEGDPLALTASVGTYGQQLQAAAIFCDIPADLRRGHLADVARRMATATVLSGGPP